MVAVFKYSGVERIAQELGLYILDAQKRVLGGASDSKRTFNVAVSGGSLISILRKALIEDDEIALQVKWADWVVYFCDERLVPLSHKDSNYGLFKKELLDPLAAKGVDLLPKVHTIDDSLLGQNCDEAIAASYSSLLPSGGRLDLVLLGCGDDGHTCSLFPGPAHAYLLEERDKLVELCKNSPKPPSDRITFTIPVLQMASAVAFIATGVAKHAIISRILRDKDQSLPCALVNRLCDSKVSWFCDTDALQDLSITVTTYATSNRL